VYVAWVRVFCEGQVRESKQKGFKTLQARVNTIWDEPDHVILGVEKTATSKEINKAFRQKSLQCHPDKETDPEKKDAAEEHMKRLNLAKSNMMKSAPKDPAMEAADEPEPQSPSNVVPADENGESGAASPSNPQRRHRNFWGDGEDSDAESYDSMEDVYTSRPPRVPRADEPEVIAPEEDKTSIPVALKIEAAKPPKLQVIERHLTSFVVEASGLPLGGSVEVQRFGDSDFWVPALPPARVTSETMRFVLSDLEENSSHRLRLRTIIELEPLRLSFAQFAPEKVAAPLSSACSSMFYQRDPAQDGVDAEDDVDDADAAEDEEGDEEEEEEESEAQQEEDEAEQDLGNTEESL